ncbi:hypothetical protein ACFLR1_02210 [Bacteroidota bacterium]
MRKIEFKEKGLSTLGARKIWFDDTVQRLNAEGRGELLGEFGAEDLILSVMQSGEYKLSGFGLSTQFDDDMVLIEKWNPDKPLSAIYYDGEKKLFMIKRFLADKSSKAVRFIPEGEKVNLELVTSEWRPRVQVSFRKQKGEEQAKVDEINVEDFIAVKGLKAKGNVLTKDTVNTIDLLEPLPYEEVVKEEPELSVAEEEPEVESAENVVNLPLDVEVVVNEAASEPEQTEEAKPKEPKPAPKKPDVPPTTEGQLDLF